MVADADTANGAHGAEQKHPWHLVDPSPWPLVGALSAGGDFISGRWAQAGREFPLVLMRMEAETVLHRPQEP